MVRQHPTRDRASKMWRKIGEQNAWGSANDDVFRPEREDLPIRCFQCSNLMEASFTSEGECPNCHWVFRKSEARDMYVEAMIVAMPHTNKNGEVLRKGGWSKEKLDVFSSYDYPVRMEPDGSIQRIEGVERTMAAWATKNERAAALAQDVKQSPEDYAKRNAVLKARFLQQEQERKKAERELIQYIRQQSPVSRL